MPSSKLNDDVLKKNAKSRKKQGLGNKWVVRNSSFAKRNVGASQTEVLCSIKQSDATAIKVYRVNASGVAQKDRVQTARYSKLIRATQETLRQDQQDKERMLKACVVK